MLGRSVASMIFTSRMPVGMSTASRSPCATLMCNLNTNGLESWRKTSETIDGQVHEVCAGGTLMWTARLEASGHGDGYREHIKSRV